MVAAHLGVAIFIVGVTMVSNFQGEEDVRMSPGDSHEIAGYRFEFLGAEAGAGTELPGRPGPFPGLRRR
jgi:cytochrome c-type biogenesis protein CcmF